MAWIISIVMLISGCFQGNQILVVTSGLFAIAGSIGGAASILKGAIESRKSGDETCLDKS